MIFKRPLHSWIRNLQKVMEYAIPKQAEVFEGFCSCDSKTNRHGLSVKGNLVKTTEGKIQVGFPGSEWPKTQNMTCKHPTTLDRTGYNQTRFVREKAHFS